MNPHSERRFPAPSSKLCQNWLRFFFFHVALRPQKPIGYATEGALFISAQMSTEAVSAFRKVWALIKLQALVWFTTFFFVGGRCRKAMLGVWVLIRLQAPVYDILPSTTAVFSYAIGSRKLSANEQFFVGAQTLVSLLQTTQIKQGVPFIAVNKVYTSTNKTTIV